MAKVKTPLDELIIESGLRMKVVASRFGLSRSGFYKKRQSPKNLTADEMTKIANIINVDETVVFEAVLKTKVS
ncbi:XRE family transcriptional regulator [Lactococcus lactis]|uniref:ACT domain-containing protein n=1 Tax=Lactococcus lactis TaxID=1358 RepID=A0AAW5TNA7_9LACT|nr:XRE family transcriptional regulator [Lactococcus lactis]MCW2281481.1 ACT domain-containing protein [Lactococcus lactis]